MPLHRAFDKWDFFTVFSHPETFLVRLDFRITQPLDRPARYATSTINALRSWAWYELRVAVLELPGGDPATVWRAVVPYMQRVMERGRQLGVGVEFHITHNVRPKGQV